MVGAGANVVACAGWGAGGDVVLVPKKSDDMGPPKDIPP